MAPQTIVAKAHPMVPQKADKTGLQKALQKVVPTANSALKMVRQKVVQKERCSVGQKASQMVVRKALRMAAMTAVQMVRQMADKTDLRKALPMVGQ
jgi:hypothetical protein